MTPNEEPPRLTHDGRAQVGDGLKRLLGSIAFAGLLVVGFMFSLVVFSILLVTGLIAGGYWWWKTRDLRRELRARMDQMAQQAQGTQDAQAGGRIIEGEVIRDADEHR
jgi:hypothetical protein